MDIHAYFERYEWSCEQADEAIWRSAFALENDEDRDLYVMVGEQWVHFAVAPFLANVADECRERLYTALLQSNQRMQRARFALDDDGDASLLAELPRAEFTYDHFALLLDALTHYARLLHPPLSRLATDPAFRWSP